MAIKATVIDLGTLRVNALEMIMGVDEEIIRNHYRVNDRGETRIGMNALLLESGNRLVILDPGTATFLSKSLAELYDLQMNKTIQDVILHAGYKVEDVTDVLFTHLHFDHGSGAFERVPGEMRKTFPNAKYIFYKEQLNIIRDLPADEAASYFHKLIRFAGDHAWFDASEFKDIEFFISHGHTGHMIVPLIHADDHDILFATDLCPMKLHLHPGSWSYYDMDAALLQEEKKKILSNLAGPTEIVYYHEPELKSEFLNYTEV